MMKLIVNINNKFSRSEFSLFLIYKNNLLPNSLDCIQKLQKPMEAFNSYKYSRY